MQAFRTAVIVVLMSDALFVSHACDDYLDPPPPDEGEDALASLGYETIYRDVPPPPSKMSSEGGGFRALRRQKRFFGGGQDLACEMLIAIDSPLYAHLGSSIQNATDLVTDLVQRLNQIYKNTIFRGEFSHLYFRVREIRVLFDFCSECNATQRIYLQEFSRMDFSEFCLAHVFTYRDFPEGVQGLAWKKTLCHDRWNTGFTTLLNHGVTATPADSGMTMAHEVGHNLGSDHDEVMGCSSTYLMSEQGSSSTDPQFSSCSIQAIVATLRDVLNDPRKNCFEQIPKSEPDDFSFCGDGVVEGEEECDCGLYYQTCGDPCCYPAHIHHSDLAENASAVPCRSNQKHVCLHPFSSTWQFGFVGPWIMILTLTVLIASALVYDWHHDRRAFTHVTDPKEMIRSETQEQVAKRLSRQRAEGKNVYVIQPESQRSLIRPAHRPPPPPPNPPTNQSRPAGPSANQGPPVRPTAPPGTRLTSPEAPKPGLVQQMREQLERGKHHK